jgi:hypothetical protein
MKSREFLVEFFGSFRYKIMSSVEGRKKGRKEGRKVINECS